MDFRNAEKPIRRVARAGSKSFSSYAAAFLIGRFIAFVLSTAQ